MREPLDGWGEADARHAGAYDASSYDAAACGTGSYGTAPYDAFVVGQPGSPEHVREYVPGHTGQHVPQYVPGRIPEPVAEPAAEHTAEHLPQHAPQHVTGPLWPQNTRRPPEPAPWETESWEAGPWETAPAPAPAGAAGPPRSPRRGHARRPKRRRRLRRTAIAVVLVALGGSAGTYAWADTKLDRQVDLDAFGSRHPEGEGTNYLIVGSDSRDGLSDQDRKNLHAGGGGGRRTDSMILLHTGANGTTMVSLPRDSWLTLPAITRPSTGKRSAAEKNKLNAAFALGGPQLLTRTIEHNTGLKIDHYAEIGFAGFVNIVNAVGGVRMCLEKDIKDEKSGTDLKKGCQTLDGAASLAFVRQRHQEAQGDLGRTRNQQKFLSSLAHRAAAPDTALNPFKLYPALDAGLDTLIVDRDMSLQDLVSMFRAVQSVTGGRGNQINVPVADLGYSTPKGSAVLWDEPQARKLFTALNHDRPVDAPGK